MALAAPTGKAAMRLSQSIGGSLDRLQLPEEVKAAIPTEAKTLHRLLGFIRHSPQFRHNRQQPMGWDVVVVDEASMVDLAMMSKLVDALKPGARLLLLGDKDQLASVESGAVLGDFIQSLPDNTIELKKTYRFDDNIKFLAERVNAGDSDGAWTLLADPQVPNVTVLQAELIDFLGRQYAGYMAEVCRYPQTNVTEIFEKFNRFQVLCAVHYGHRGVVGINRGVETFLARQGFDCRPDSWYPGRPVLITRNEYSLDLFNGDIGICLPDLADGSSKVWFEQSDGGLRSYSPYRLPSCETVFAMTIHKSQGSEFDEVVVVLPEEDNRILSRELLYTAFTRSRKMVKLVAGRQVFAQALSRKIERCSGLADLLQEQTQKSRELV
jgi:exodeoxyribonuclease V alpha subunit